MYEDGFQPANQVTVESTETDWPGKQANDVGWAYAGIIGEFARGAWVTGVTIIVAREGKELLIRDIEWGRP